jgi:hypothetical protein
MTKFNKACCESCASYQLAELNGTESPKGHADGHFLCNRVDETVLRRYERGEIYPSLEGSGPTQQWVWIVTR